MPEIDLYLDQTDEIWLAEVILTQGARMVGDLWFTEPRYSEIVDLNGFSSARQSTRQFYVVHHNFSDLPLEMVRQGVDVFRYYIMPRNGGPALSFLCGGAKEQAGRLSVLPGGLQSYPTYWDSGAETNRKIPVAQVLFYKSLVGEIKKRFRRIKLKSRASWIGPHALELFEQGAMLIGVDESLSASIRAGLRK